MLTAALSILSLALSILSLALTATAWPVSQSGCGKPLPSVAAKGQYQNYTITSSGVERSYLFFIPPEYETWHPASIIFSYHGGNRDALSQLQLDNLTAPWFNKDALVVYPQGIADSWQGVPGDMAKDVQFTIDVLDLLQSQVCIDPTRIFATGKSDGAGLCNVLACDPTASSRFAAFAPVSGAYYVDTLPCDAATVTIPCSPSRQHIPMLVFHGGNDSTINYYGGERKNACLPTIPHFVQEWALRDGLSDQNTSTYIAANTQRFIYGQRSWNWNQAALVEHIYDSVNGHDWPSTLPNSDNMAKGQHPTSFNATPIILDFFHQHPMY